MINCSQIQTGDKLKEKPKLKRADASMQGTKGH